jgi:hypothetical protein
MLNYSTGKDVVSRSFENIYIVNTKLCQTHQRKCIFFLNRGAVSHSHTLCTEIRWAGPSNPGGERMAHATQPTELRAPPKESVYISGHRG